MNEHELTALIAGIKHMEIHDGDGLRTTIFFKGCPLRCVWCHNPETLSYEPQTALFASKCIGCGSCSALCPTGAVTLSGHKAAIDLERCIHCFACADECPSEAIVGFGRKYTVDTLYREIMTEAPFFANGRGGVTFSGGECLTQPDFAIVLARKFFESGISVDIDTCGYVQREILERILPYTDTFLFDIKAVDAKVHRLCTGKDNQRILENLHFLSEKGCRIEIRYPLVSGWNDGECEAIARLLHGIPGIVGVKILRYHNLAGSRYHALGMTDTLPPPLTTDEDVEKARDIFQKKGITVKK